MYIYKPNNLEKYLIFVFILSQREGLIGTVPCCRIRVFSLTPWGCKLDSAVLIWHDSSTEHVSSHNFKQVPGVTDIGLVPRRVKKVAILGGGLMGSGIATALILSNYPVILKEVNDKFLQAGIGRVTGEARIPQRLLLIISIL